MSSLQNLTIDDTSPLFTYCEVSYCLLNHSQRFSADLQHHTVRTVTERNFVLIGLLFIADGSGSGLANGWIPWYTTTGFVTQPGQGGTGDSYHLTSLSGASVGLKFYGTAVYLYGTTNSSYDGALDGKTYSLKPTGSNLLFYAMGLPQGSHYVSLTPRITGSQQFALDRAVISTQYDDPPVEVFYDNSDTSVLKYAGAWITQSAPGIPNATVSHPWQQTVDPTGSVSMEISGAVGVSIYGMANWGSWVYTVGLDGAEESHNASTFWKVPNALLVDPAKNHTVTLRNVASGMKLNVNSFKLYKADAGGDSIAPAGSPTPSGSSSPTSRNGSSVKLAAIVGPLAALAIIVLAVAGWLVLRRSRSRQEDSCLESADPDEKRTKLPRLPGFSSPNHSSDRESSISPRGTTFAASAEGGRVQATTATTLASYGDMYIDTNLASESEQATSPSTAPSTYAPSSDARTAFSTSDSHGSKRTMLLPANPPTTRTPSTPLDSRDVDYLVQLIAQRIDPVGRGGDSIAPPEYRAI
ncbi:TPR-REGION domain-containing protein [Mycena indigotica]|uniref:TPR-REGION domain-containing protein n=1 Tax=Mycena indigotica TaxID=2126181 RepID=A0A8H6WCE7_9AGAR|nr:TPR-REGION domain-containing protein [Mycena indigotica]KAF7307284.1 TPR-REGION domain-containing protein [Mycena indigotica]